MVNRFYMARFISSMISKCCKDKSIKVEPDKPVHLSVRTGEGHGHPRRSQKREKTMVSPVIYLQAGRRARRGERPDHLLTGALFLGKFSGCHFVKGNCRFIWLSFKRGSVINYTDKGQIDGLCCVMQGITNALQKKKSPLGSDEDSQVFKIPMRLFKENSNICTTSQGSKPSSVSQRESLAPSGVVITLCRGKAARKLPYPTYNSVALETMLF